MGTFHHDKHQLHGITVVVDTNGPRVYVGRCDDMDDTGIILLDCDQHDDGADGKSKIDWLTRAAKFGVFPKQRKLVVAASEIATVRRLADITAELT